MASPGASAPRERPLLAGGERLARDAQPARAPGEKYHPQSLAEARQRLGPAAREIRQRAQTMPQHLRGERVILEATLLPNYLAASHHPRRLRDDADLVALGTRTATGTLRTAREVKENQPTKTLLLAATERSLRRLEALLGDEQARAGENVLSDLTKLQEISLPSEVDVLRAGRQPQTEQNADEDDETWEAVLHPAIDAAGNVSQNVLELILGRWRALVKDHGGKVHRELHPHRRAAHVHAGHHPRGGPAGSCPIQPTARAAPDAADASDPRRPALDRDPRRVQPARAEHIRRAHRGVRRRRREPPPA